jgi:exportin-5
MADPSGVSSPPTNGFQNHTQASSTPDVTVILQAIEAVYNPRSTNDVRHAANELLENTKSSPEARELGFNLAFDPSKDPTLRHYGLTLLDYHTRYVWDGYDEDMEAVLRDCIVKLAQGVRKEDPTYLRNKVAHLWTVFAKRSWATYWMNMDEQLVQLFEASEAHREVVLYVLQTLAEDVFSRDDTLAATRGEVLAAGCIEIFTPEALMLDKNVSKTGHAINVRYGTEGWLQRLCTFLEWSLGNDHTAAVKTLDTVGSALSWVPSATIAATSSIVPVCRAVVVGDAAIRLAAVEALTTICSRDKMPDDDALKIVMPLFASDSVQSLQSVYQWAKVDPNDIDDQKYTLLQKTSKLLSRLGAWIEKNPALLPETSDLPRFFELLFEVARDVSLKVSEPVLRLWTHLLRIPTLRDSAIIQQSIGPLMEMCSRRLVRYEALPEDTNDPIVMFVNEDFDTIPEKHMFLGNYRRYCVDVVEAAVRKFPVDAVSHILGQAQSLFRDIQASMQDFQRKPRSTHSLILLLLTS